MKYNNNVPFLPKVMDLGQVWFSGGRTGATLLGHGGIGEIVYYGNQLIAYYPSWSEVFYRNTMRLAGRERELEKWFDDVEWFWHQHTLPEGFTYDAENEGFTPDNPGCKQAFGGQAWYAVFFTAILGLAIDEQGLILSSTPLHKQMNVRGLIVRGKRIDIAVTGKGPDAGISVNGERVDGPTVRIPFAHLKANNRIVI